MFGEDPWQHCTLLEGGKGNLGPWPPAELRLGLCAPGRSSQERKAGAALRKLPRRCLLETDGRVPFRVLRVSRHSGFPVVGGGLLLRKQLAFVYKNV